MHRFQDISIRRKLTLGMTLVAGLALLLAALASLTYEAHSFRVSKVRQLTAIAEVIGQNSRAALAFNDPGSEVQILESLRGITGVERACVFDAGGRAFADYPAAPAAPAPAPPGGERFIFRNGSLEVFHEVRQESGLLGTVYLRSDLKDLWRAMTWNLFFNLLILAGLVLLAYWISHRFQGLITAPLLDLAMLARRVSEEKDYSVRAAGRGKDEIGSLVDAVNDMLREIQARDDRLLDYHEHLEDQVASRTEELLQSNQELLVAKQRAEEVSRAKSAFLANMSHELRTPLNAILLYSELLQEDAKEQERESDLTDLQRIHASGLHLLSLINDVLDLSKVEAGKMSLALEPVDLRNLVEECVQTIHPLAEKNGNTLHAAFPDRHPAFLGDATKLRQALFNLLANACKFTEKGRVDLRILPVQRGGAPWLRFEVQDSGIGMNPQQLERIFLEFTQAEEGTSKRFGGTGLGLTLSRRLCQLMGGDISVTSEPGQGSTFVLEIPAPPAAVRGALAGPVSGSGIRRILVAVDDLSIPDALARRLGEAGYALKAGPSGEDGLRFSRPDQPGDLILEVTPPAPHGDRLLAELQQREDWRERPSLLVVSSSLGAEQQARLSEAGVVLVFDTSAQPLEALLATVEVLLQPAAGRTPHA
jgi:signal transduction histidine kinase